MREFDMLLLDYHGFISSIEMQLKVAGLCSTAILFFFFASSSRRSVRYTGGLQGGRAPFIKPRDPPDYLKATFYGLVLFQKAKQYI